MLASIHDPNSSRTPVIDDKMDISATGAGTRGRQPVDVAEHLRGPTFAPDRPVACVANRDVVGERAQWRNPELKPQVEASRSSAAEGVEAVMPS